MNSSAGQVVRKRRFGAVMVTVVALAGAVWALTVPAEARRHAHSGWDFGWGDLFWHPQRKLHRTVHAAKVPLPVPRPQVPPTQAFRTLFGDNFFYILYFQEPGVADAELDADPARTMRRVMAGRPALDQSAAMRMLAPGPEGFVDRLPEPDGLPDWLSQDELDYYINEFSRTGFTGGLNWYRNFDRNWETTAELADAKAALSESKNHLLGSEGQAGSNA